MRTLLHGDTVRARTDPKLQILELLNENRVMCVATLRPDGWPQATMVGYVHDDLTLYFVVARISQKLTNIAREPRISIALGHDRPDRLRGLSMAARAAEVTELAEIDHLNALMLERYPGQVVFSPRESSTAVLRATPEVISVVDLPKGPGEPELVRVSDETSVYRIPNGAAFGRPGRAGQAATGATVGVRYTHARQDAYRPGAPL
jgi:nitroimidazol reductase NimA-like FMN-containing flavoprotein (pyridoxamine 5'-phosphate oxidase superfamily)